jgi:translation initiation factor 2 subunit 1
MAIEQEIRRRSRRFQALHNVSLTPPRFVVVCFTMTLVLTCPSNADIWKDIAFPSEAVAEELKSYIANRLTPQPIKVRADVEVTCFGYEGIDAIKTALRTAEANNTAETSVKVRLVSSPLYVLTSTCLDEKKGIARLEEAIVEIRKSIEGAGVGGSMTVKMAPRAVTKSDDAELQALMEKRERENAEVSGDDSMSESDDNIPETL